MRIALLTEKYPPDVGGLAVSSERLARLLVRAGHGVHALVPTMGLVPGRSACAEQGGVTIHRIGTRRRLDDTLADWFDYLLAQHWQHAFDILHGYFVTQAGFVAVYAGQTIGLPSVVSARGNDLDRAVFDPGKTAHTLYALQHADAITANSRDLVRKAHALAPGRKVSWIPNGIDADRFAPTSRDESLKLSLGLDELHVVGFVGEARAKKGLAALLVATREVARRQPVTLLLVGGAREGDDADTLQVFQKQNPDLLVVVVPPVSAATLPAYYNLIDVLLVPSLRDGLPNALLEGMACGCAIVATFVGGIPDAIHDGENGRLVPPGDAAALAGAIHELLDSADLRQRLGRNARATVIRDFTPEQELEGNLAVYRQVMGDKRRVAGDE